MQWRSGDGRKRDCCFIETWPGIAKRRNNLGLLVAENYSKSTIVLLMSSRGKIFYWLWYQTRRLALSDMNEICASISTRRVALSSTSGRRTYDWDDILA